MLDFSRKDKEEQGTQVFWVSLCSFHTLAYEVIICEEDDTSITVGYFTVYEGLLAYLGLPKWLSGKGFVCQCRRLRFDSGSGRSPGVGNSNPLQNSCLENSTNREDWWAAVHRIAKSCTWLSEHACCFIWSWQSHETIILNSKRPRNIPRMTVSEAGLSA